MKPKSAHQLASEAAQPYMDQAKRECLAGENDWTWLTMLNWRLVYIRTLRQTETERRPPPTFWGKHRFMLTGIAGIAVWLGLVGLTVFAASHG